MENEQCPVCLENIEQEIGLPCDHKFCATCIHSWAVQAWEENESNTNDKPTCPLCRTSFSMSVFDEFDDGDRCQCGKKNPDATHESSNSHNTYLFNDKYNSDIYKFLDNEYKRLFETEVLRYVERGLRSVEMGRYFDIAGLAYKMSDNMLTKIGSNSEEHREKGKTWFYDYIAQSADERRLESI